jgi:hypothetical protein
MSHAEIDKQAKILWDYMHMHHKLQKADAIIVGCTYYLPLADYAAELFHKGFAPWIVFSGHSPVLTEHVFDKSEAEVFADRAIECGVPADRILIEPEARNSEQNFVFSRDLLKKRHIPVKRIIVVQKPYIERRMWATVRKHWPAVEAIVTSPPISYEEYMSKSHRERSLRGMVGEVLRIKTYPARNFQIPQPMSDEVWAAYEKMVELGYTPRTDKHKDNLQHIPGVGPSLSADLRLLDIHTIADLKGKNPQEMYDRLCAITHSRQDPCVLYVFRGAVYFASHTTHDPKKLKWWYWKNDRINEDSQSTL